MLDIKNTGQSLSNKYKYVQILKPLLIKEDKILTFCTSAASLPAAPPPPALRVPALPLPALPLVVVSEGAVGVGHGVDGRLGDEGVAGVGQGPAGVHRAGRERRVAGHARHPAHVVAGHLAAQLGLDEVDLAVVVLLEGGAVPPPRTELVLALVDGANRAQAHAVHEPRVPLAELNLNTA